MNLILIFTLSNSSSIDYSDKISDQVSAIFDFNKTKLDLQLIAERRGIPFEKLAIPKQIHSSKITYIDKPGNYPDTDGLITNTSNVFLTLNVADCVPVYISNFNSSMIGLIHSGWRGTIGGVVINAVRKMLEMGVNKNEVIVFLGPAIGCCCYEVDGEVADNFNNKAKTKMESGKWKVGLHEQIYLQLIQLKIPSTNINRSDICTFESPICHSYRQNGPNAGRMIAFMRLKP